MKHGGDLTEAMARHGGAPQQWLDLSTGINPWPWPIPVISDEAWQRLPSRADAAALIDAARTAYGVPAATSIVAASGTQSLIQWLPHLATPGPVAIVGPTYSEHASAWRSAGREVIAIGDISELPQQARHAVIVNPNNPDGRIVDRATLAAAARLLQPRGGWLVIDEAFADVTPEITASALCADLPIVILRSFGKFYGLGGLRLGFALAAPSIADRIQAAMGPWCCSGPALQIGAAALCDHVWAEATRAALARQAARLDAILRNAGLELIGGTALYRLTRHREAVRIHAALAQQQIWCRRFDWANDLLRFGLPPDDAALDRLAAALSDRR
ncbi:cobalamin biosynthetic protein CobC [Rhodopseudomonas rhenobacensis]|uniref:threonine-phosphate decarboxylase n=1 Tax=Rhodopseudomonas rhenobacensis TaxID=87461 RepID=A0A7W8DYY8_9BRAD|nr:threonine-phosphate decarboxylase CobD [Rhodopseudomonas rhenobacensis]MBB5047330.1 cobalamin biosynthetic protein CobC [Rhodopseudomonas rhenobacensis]